jgi:hypothetical protein
MLSDAHMRRWTTKQVVLFAVATVISLAYLIEATAKLEIWAGVVFAAIWIAVFLIKKVVLERHVAAFQS